jgi:hypothetical protein
MRAVSVVVSDLMQRGYQYQRTERAGCMEPAFKPDLSPPQMLELGVFGGKYLTDCTAEFPDDWFVKAKLCSERLAPELNYFGIRASTSLSNWRERNWIRDQDPRGWFPWYCRYYMGRRSADDDRQIARWKAMRRHVAQVRKNCEPWDLNCRKKQRQALLQWAYDSREF